MLPNMTFPVSDAVKETMIDVGDGHQLYVAEFGNPKGFPVVYLHGGPGAGHSPAWQKYFNPDFYRIILFDQRGCGRSIPFAETANNSIRDLVEDIEKIRSALGIEKWVVGGGSWGSALSLIYAMNHPDHVAHILLRGVFFATKQGASHIAEEGGAEPFYPEDFEYYRDLVPQKDRRAHGLISAYNEIMQKGVEADMLEAAKRFMVWDTSIAFAKRESAKGAIEAIKQNPREEIPITKIFMHYSVHEFCDSWKERILGSGVLRSIPMDIIHGRLDRICPVQNAIDLHAAFKHSNLHILESAGHSGMDEGVAEYNAFVTEKIRKNIILRGL